MVDDLIPQDIKQFILDKMDSVAQLEGLLLLRSNPQMDWSVEEVGRRLYISQQQAAEVLAHLFEEGFLTAAKGESSSYRFQPNTPELGGMVDRVAELYSKYLVSVTNLIHSKPQTKVQKFADAFKLRKGRNE